MIVIIIGLIYSISISKYQLSGQSDFLFGYIISEKHDERF